MPYADPARQRQFRRELAQKRRSLGLCANCNSPARSGKTRCQPCQTAADAATKRRRQRKP